MLDELVIQPSERYIVELLFTETGTASIEEVNTKKSLVTFTVGDEGDDTYAEFFSTLRTTEILPESTLTKVQAENPARTLVLDMFMKGGMMMDHSMMGHSMPCHQMPNGTWMGDCAPKEEETSTTNIYPPINPKSIEWEDTMNMMNSGSDTDMVEWKITEKETGKSNMDIHWTSTVGSYEKLRIENPTTSMHPMQHPIHMHGQRFLVLSRDGKPEETLLWKDTVAIPTGSTYDLLVEYTNPGKWMFHCHIPEHMESGMMGHFEVK
jgi:FtsP/CotA-like multicopper oxidase with cupredoxin domain